MNGQERWTVGNVHAKDDQLTEKLTKSRSRFKIERNAVVKIRIK